MRHCARAIVIKDDKLLVMKRFKMGKTYYTLLGGTIEPNESPDVAAVREVKEESGIDIGNLKLVFKEHAGDPYGDQWVYLCEYVSGEPKLSPNSGEAFWTVEGKNTYEPMWLPLAELKAVPFVSEILKLAILEGVKNGFPSEPYEFSPKYADRLS